MVKDKINTDTLSSVLINNDLHLKCSSIHFLCQQNKYPETQSSHMDSNRIVCSEFIIITQGLFWEWTIKMKLLSSIVLLKIKAQKSKHCPFLVNTSAPSVFVNDRWSVAEADWEILEGTWSRLLSWERAQRLWILVLSTGDLTENF